MFDGIRSPLGGMPSPFGGRDGWSPVEFFRANEVGVWFDPSDLSTMFQDAAGTTPVTAVEQPVGLHLDKSGRGNHRTQSTSAARPTLSARYNLALMTPMTSLTGSAGSQYPNASGWATLFNSGGTRTYVASSIYPGDQALDIAGVVSARNMIGFDLTPLASTTYTVSFDIESVSGVTGIVAYATGTLGSGGASNNITAPSSTGRVFYTFTTGTSPGTVTLRFGIGTSTNESGSIRISGIDIRVTNDGVGLPAYQRVNTSTDYDTVGFPKYLKYDGTDDFMQTAAVDFSATDKVTAFVGARKLVEGAGYYVVTELTTTADATNGAFNLGACTLNGDASRRTWASVCRGTAQSLGGASVYAAPDSRVITGVFDLSAASSALGNILRLNGTQQSLTLSGSAPGGGNFSNAALYFGARAGTSLFFNGREYQTIIRGAASTATEIAAAELYVNQKTKAY